MIEVAKRLMIYLANAGQGIYMSSVTVIII